MRCTTAIRAALPNSGGTSFLTELKSDGSLAYSTFFSGGSADNISAVAFDSSGHLYIAGETSSQDLPVTSGALQPHFGAVGAHGFIASVDFAATPSSAPGIDAPEIDGGCVVNAASYLSIVASGYPGGAVAPGEIISVFGTGLGPANGVGAVVDSQGRVATTLASVTLTFDGVAAPILYAQANQINAIVPFEVSGKQTTQLQLKYQGASSNVAALLVRFLDSGALASSPWGRSGAARQQRSIRTELLTRLPIRLRRDPSSVCGPQGWDFWMHPIPTDRSLQDHSANL